MSLDPKCITLSKEEMAALIERVKQSHLSDHDKKLITGVFSFNHWLQTRLERAKLTIKRLKSIFGIKTEKKKEADPPTENGTQDSDGPSPKDSASNAGKANTNPPKSPKFNPAANHGRYGHADYTGLAVEKHSHDTLKAGGLCPDCKDDNTVGKLYKLPDSVCIRLTSQPLFTGTKHLQEQLRCNLCQTIFKAPVPKEVVNKPKYDDSCYASLIYYHYGSGLPLYRIQRTQAAQGVPLATSTQWGMIETFTRNTLYPVFNVLEDLCAQSSHLFWDDGHNKILSLPKKSKHCYTTVITGKLEGKIIRILYTNEKQAGKEIEGMLGNRKINKPFFSMTDALQNNFPKKTSDQLLAFWVVCFCLVHGRRRFYELCDSFPVEAKFVLKCLTEIYANEANCKRQNLSDQERLIYHQTHSKPIMEALHVWMNNQLLYFKNTVESNGPLAQAIAYWLKRWDHLTQFLRVAGAPIDNSISERLVKCTKLYIKNSYFYKTSNGARIGDVCMSLIFTCESNGINPHEYLLVLRANQVAVQANPDAWLPWNYKQTMSTADPPLQKAS